MIKAIKYQEENIGKTVKSSKVKHSWTFLINNSQ